MARTMYECVISEEDNDSSRLVLKITSKNCNSTKGEIFRREGRRHGEYRRSCWNKRIVIHSECHCPLLSLNHFHQIFHPVVVVLCPFTREKRKLPFCVVISLQPIAHVVPSILISIRSISCCFPLYPSAFMVTNNCITRSSCLTDDGTDDFRVKQSSFLRVGVLPKSGPKKKKKLCA